MGDVTVTRITEWEGTAPITAQLAPEGGREVWERHSSWLAPNFWNRESNEVTNGVASFEDGVHPVDGSTASRTPALRLRCSVCQV
jgi:hypothetical protein